MPILFFLFWIVLNGRITLEIVLFGILISAAMILLHYRSVHYTPERDIFVLRNVPVLLHYMLVLIREILCASFQVMSWALSPKKHPQPVIVEFHSQLASNQLNVLLANSITLTPGTYTLFQEGDHFVIHCLSDEFSKGLEDSAFIRLLRRMHE